MSPPLLTQKQKSRLINRFKHQQTHKLQTLLDTIQTKSQIQKQRTLRRKLFIPVGFRELKVKEVLTVERTKKVKVWEVIRDVLKQRGQEGDVKQKKDAVNASQATESEEAKRARRIEEIKKWREGRNA
ncbi:hypothetical protein WICPIJ_002609 [Wickerhamomyces pijperi]|uniref:Uncharacterized protein n=1 Tax=Wickerhamomyces pijperi TaxID=599730 RepID=A0A9P8QB68_WICPI|nr:hypothetical protein WICPIJ_002609 [Wickerhamomyces pijperi]